MLKKYFIPFLLSSAILFCVFPSRVVGESSVLYPGFPPVEESWAYAKFLEGPKTDYAKILFLINRFSEADVKIVYDGYRFSAAYAGRFSRWFLSTQYRGETPKKWIMRWCSTSILKGELIWVHLPDKKFRLSREILLEEIKALEELLEREIAS